MAFRPDHELHRRRWGRNMGVFLVLACFAALVFALTIVKISQGATMQAFDHVLRPELLPAPATAPEIAPEIAP